MTKDRFTSVCWEVLRERAHRVDVSVRVCVCVCVFFCRQDKNSCEVVCFGEAVEVEVAAADRPRPVDGSVYFRLHCTAVPPLRERLVGGNFINSWASEVLGQNKVTPVSPLLSPFRCL